MRITVEFAPESDPQIATPREFENVAGFCTSFSDFSDGSDKLPKFAGNSSPGVGLMMVRTVQVLNVAGAFAPEWGHARCTLAIFPESEEEQKRLAPQKIESDEGMVLIDTQAVFPTCFGWCEKDGTLDAIFGIRGLDWLMAAYLPKIEGSLQTAHASEIVYSQTRRALADHMQWMAEQDAGAALMAKAMENPEGVHLLGKGVPKKLRGRRPR